MQKFNNNVVESEALVAGEWDESFILSKFSLKTVESEESLAKIKKHTATWKTKHKEWKKMEVKRKAKWVKEHKAKLKELKDESKLKGANKVKIQKQIDKVNKDYYESTNPPFPASDVPIVSQLDYLAKNEYIPKPYDVEALIELIESNPRLKSSISVKAQTTVGLGATYRPTNGRNVADFTPEELEEYYRQGKELLAWYNARTEQGKAFYQIAQNVQYSRNAIGEGYFEVIDSRIGNIVQIKYISGNNIWEGSEGDRYIYIKNGKKKYFKKFADKSIKHVDTFKNGAPLSKRATRLLPLREFNMISIVYGVPVWSPAIPEILGRRYSSERNVNLQLNDATPRMIVTVSGGAVDNTTTSTIKKFFAKKGEGRENAGRVLIMSISSKNQLSPNSKPPVVSFEKLTVGTNEDASFMEYGKNCDVTVLECFKIGNTFLGNSSNVNRASSYTLRDLITQTVLLPEGEQVAVLCNDTFTYEYAIEKKYITLDANNIDIENSKLLAELMFIPVQTMSQKDAMEIGLAQLGSGALTIDEFRADVLGLPMLNSWLGKVNKTVAITMMQLSEVSPALIGSLLDDPELAAAIKQDKLDDDIQDTEEKTVDDTVKALVYMRQGLNKLLTHKHVSADTTHTMERFYDSAINASSEEDREQIKRLFHREE